MATKTFRIGECAVGGLIKVDITGMVIQVKALDFYTKKVVDSGSAMLDDPNIERKLDNYIITLTTSYYTGKIMEWIKSKTNIKMMWH